MSLLERFQADCHFDSLGEFTLDKSKAQQKMANFQLANKQEFLMLIVQAAVAASCTSIEVCQSEGVLQVFAKDALLDDEAISNLEDFLLDASSDNLSYNLLAVALNAIRSSCVSPPKAVMRDGHLVVRLDLKVELANLSKLLSTRLQYLPCPLSLDEVPIPTTALGEDPVVRLSLTSIGQLQLIRFGVVMPNRQIGTAPGFEAIARVDDLSLDASFSQVIEDERYTAILARVKALANEALADFARTFAGEGKDAIWLRSLLVAKLDEPARSALESCPLFPLADRPDFTSLRDLRRSWSKYGGKVLTSRSRLALRLELSVVLIGDPEVKTTLGAFFPPESFEDASGVYSARLALEERKKAWENSPRPLALPPGNYLGERSAEGPGWKAVIGLLADPGGTSGVDVLYQGKLLSYENLEEVPPGTTAVLDCSRGEVNESWTRLDGREYRAALKSLRQEANGLLISLEVCDPKDISIDLEVFLRQCLSKKEVPKLALCLPLLQTVIPGSKMSIDQLRQFERVGVAYNKDLPPQLSREKLPPAVFVYSDEIERILVGHLGKDRVEDLRPLYDRFEALANELANPRPACVQGGDVVFRRPVALDFAQGELGLSTRSGRQVLVDLMQRGAVFETIKLEATKVFQAKIAVECPLLHLARDWSGFLRDSAYDRLLEALREELKLLEQEALKSLDVSPTQKMLLLKAYPQEKEILWRLPLFLRTDGGWANLRELENEVATYGNLLWGGESIFEPRCVLRKPGKEGGQLISDSLGSVVWEDVQTMLAREDAARKFENRPKVRVIRLGKDARFARSFKEGKGEIGVARKPRFLRKRQGYVDCYVDHRLVCRREGLLPWPCVGAVESPLFTLGDQGRDLRFADELRGLLRSYADECMLELARQGSSSDLDLAWDYFTDADAQEETKRHFLQTQFVHLADGDLLTFDRLFDLKVRGYVSSEFQGQVTRAGDAVVLRLSEGNLQRYYKVFPGRLTCFDTEFEADMRYRAQLEALPTSLGQEALFCQTFNGGGFTAEVGLSPKVWAVARSAEGSPIGRLRSFLLPVQVFVSAPDALWVKGRKRNDVEVSLPRAEAKRLAAWLEDYCRRWVIEQADLIKEGHEVLMWALLRASIRELGATSTALSEIAKALWDRPMFMRVDGTRVSGSALAGTLTETGQPLLLAQTRTRVETSAIYIIEGCDAHQVLSSVLGKKSLQWVESQPLFNYEELKASIERLKAWGFSTAVALGKRYNKLVGSVEPQQNETGDRSSSTSFQSPFNKPAKRNEAPRRDPQEQLLIDLQEDVKTFLGSRHQKRSQALFDALDFGYWPLGPAIYRRMGGLGYRLNLVHKGVRWMLATDGNHRTKRVARSLLLILWVGIVNVGSESLTDDQEEQFLDKLPARLRQVYGAEAATAGVP